MLFIVIEDLSLEDIFMNLLILHHFPKILYHLVIFDYSILLSMLHLIKYLKDFNLNSLESTIKS